MSSKVTTNSDVGVGTDEGTANLPRISTPTTRNTSVHPEFPPAPSPAAVLEWSLTEGTIWCHLLPADRDATTRLKPAQHVNGCSQWKHTNLHFLFQLLFIFEWKPRV